MIKRSFALPLALFALILTSCSGEEKAKSEIDVKIVYGQGFFNEEKDPGAGLAWRWMEPEGIVKLHNTGRDMTLKLKGNAPVASFKEAPTVSFIFNGKLLEAVKATTEVMNKEYTITAAQQGSEEWSELKITSDKFFVPSEVDKKSTDGRRLAYSLMGLSWEPK